MKNLIEVEEAKKYKESKDFYFKDNLVRDRLDHL